MNRAPGRGGQATGAGDTHSARAGACDHTQEHLGLRTLRRYSEGVLAFGERRSRVRFVLDRSTGQVVMPLEPVALSAKEHVLFLPDETGCVLQVLLLVDELRNPSAHEAPDRWTAYHAAAVGAPSAAGVWTMATVEAGKTETVVFPGEELHAANPLRGCEHGLIRHLNGQRRAAVGAACKRRLGVDVLEPMVVGLDPLGIDVRARFGVLRLEFERWAHSEEEAQRELASVLGEGAMA